MAPRAHVVAAVCLAVTVVMATGAVAASATADAPSSLQLVNEGSALPSGLTVQITAGGTTTLFAKAGPGPSALVHLPAAASGGTPVTLTLVNASSGNVAGELVQPGGFAAGRRYILFVTASAANDDGFATPGPHSLAATVLPWLPAPIAWPAQRTDVAMFRVVSADLSHPVVSVNTTSSNCWQCLPVFRSLAVAASNEAPAFMTAAVRCPRETRVQRALRGVRACVPHP